MIFCFLSRGSIFGGGFFYDYVSISLSFSLSNFLLIILIRSHTQHRECPERVVTFCTAGLRSGVAAERIAKVLLGKRDPPVSTWNLSGGIVSAAHAIQRRRQQRQNGDENGDSDDPDRDRPPTGLAIVDPKGRETRTVHVFGKQWSLLPHGWKAVTFGPWDTVRRGVKAWWKIKFK